MEEMNATLAELAKKYQDKVQKTKGESFLVADFYRRAAESVLALALQ